MTTNAAGPREQAIRQDWNAQYACEEFVPDAYDGDTCKNCNYSSPTHDVKYLLSLLDALRPEESPPPKGQPCHCGDDPCIGADRMRQGFYCARESREVASLRAQLTNEQAHFTAALKSAYDKLDTVRAQLTEAQQARDILDTTCACYASEMEAAEATLASLRQMAEDWKRSASEMEHNRGQRTREQKGYEVLANCAYAVDAALAGAGPTPPQEPT